MDFKPQVKWIVLPAGAEQPADRLTLHFSVLASIEMLAATDQNTGKRVGLEQSPFKNWPQFLAGLNFILQLGAGAWRTVAPRMRGDQSLWQTFFGDVTAVLRDPTGSPTQTSNPEPASDVRSFSYETAHQQLRSFYRLAAENSLSAPRPVALRAMNEGEAEASPLRPSLPSIPHLRDTFGSLAPPPSASREFLRGGNVSPRSQQSGEGLIGATAFYNRKSDSTESPERNFMATNATSSENPSDTDIDFHRWLSLVGQYPWLQRQLGLLLDFDVDLTAGAIAAGDGYVSISTSPSLSGPKIRTRYQFQTNPPSFEALWSDETAAPYGCLPLGNAAYNLSQVGVDGGALRAEAFGREVHTMPDDASAAPPALRTGPLSVAKADLAKDLAGKVVRAKQLHSSAQQAGTVDLHGEDLVKGIRVDVLDHQRWFPLCERESTLSLVGRESNADPKFVDQGWVTLALTTQNDEAFLHEALFSWPGWSLVASRPGKTMGQQGEAIDWIPPVQGKARVYVKRGPTKYPAYRLDREYRFRARTVDLAGRSKELPPAANLDSRIVTNPQKGYRYEPVGAPLVLPQSDFKTSPGESVRILVIRTTHDGFAQPASTARHIAPPPIDYVLAEMHSLFDEKGAPSKHKYKEVVRASKSPAFANDINWFDPSPELRVEYTEDPLCGGVVFFGLPNTNSPFFVRQDKPQPFRIKLIAGNSAPSWDKTDRILTVAMPLANTAKVQVASILRPNSLSVLGMWEWIRTTGGGLSEDDALNGLLWPLTPSRGLTLMHAVERPLREPVPHLAIASRKPNDTLVTLQGDVDLDVPSTGEIELIGEYTEWIDGPDIKKAMTELRSSHALAITAVPDTTNGSFKFRNPNTDLPGPLVRQNFPDTRHRFVAYSAVATSRFKEQFGYSNDYPPAHPHLISRRTYDGSDKRRNEKKGDKDQRVWIHVPSTARPSAPDVHCILPLYGWCDPVAPTKGTLKRTLKGGGLRIYLKKGWYSTGEGEQLAVILWPGAKDWFSNSHNEYPVDLRPFVSQWGMDPIWASPDLQTLLGPEHFLNRAGVSDVDHTLPEFEVPGNAPYPDNRKVSAVLFNPIEDSERGLWYIDVEMKDGLTYTPFIRLALARFQNYSIQETNSDGTLIRDVHLSHAVLADFVQLPSGRSATIVEDRRKKQLAITVMGLSYSGAAASDSRASMDATLEVRDDHVPLGWSPVVNKSVTLTPSPSPTDSTTIWQGSLLLDHHIRHHKHRVVLRETVSLLNGEGTSGKRLVYADVMEL
jgi:hypothetical protein